MIRRPVIRRFQMPPRLLRLVGAQRLEGFAELFLRFRREKHARKTGSRVRVRRGLHLNHDSCVPRDIAVEFLRGILITGRDDLYGVLGCGNPAEFYVSSQGCSLTGNLPRRSNQGDHSGLFKWTAVRSPDVNVQVDGRIAAPQRGRADAPAVRAAGIRRRPLRENGMREEDTRLNEKP